MVSPVDTTTVPSVSTRMCPPSYGPTPVPALGATDQHSQVQLFMEGPGDKTVTFIAVALLKPGWEEEYDSRPPVHPVACLGRVVADPFQPTADIVDMLRMHTAGGRSRAARPRCRPAVEQLESRLTPSTAAPTKYEQLLLEALNDARANPAAAVSAAIPSSRAAA